MMTLADWLVVLCLALNWGCSAVLFVWIWLVSHVQTELVGFINRKEETPCP